jgi:hypothetical protein
MAGTLVHSVAGLAKNPKVCAEQMLERRLDVDLAASIAPAAALKAWGAEQAPLKPGPMFIAPDQVDNSEPDETRAQSAALDGTPGGIVATELVPGAVPVARGSTRHERSLVLSTVVGRVRKSLHRVAPGCHCIPYSLLLEPPSHHHQTTGAGSHNFIKGPAGAT